MPLWTYRRRFRCGEHDVVMTMDSGFKGLSSRLLLDGQEIATDSTPSAGPDATRNHRLAARLPDGRMLEVEAGYIDWVNIGIAARVDGAPLHESHPGRTIAFPASMREMTQSATDPTAHFKRNGPSIAVDIALGLLFFAVARMFDLTTAALVGAAAGMALVVIQRFVKVDLLGGLALFGVGALLLSAGYAYVFQDEEAVKMRTTVVGLIVAACFVTDGLAGGRWLGRGLARYMPYDDIKQARLSLGVGVMGAVMAGLNVLVVRSVPTDVWLLYTTFGDTLIAVILFFAVLRFARPAPQAPARTP
jgi:intracellular septation protein A